MKKYNFQVNLIEKQDKESDKNINYIIDRILDAPFGDYNQMKLYKPLVLFEEIVEYQDFNKVLLLDFIAGKSSYSFEVCNNIGMDKYDLYPEFGINFIKNDINNVFRIIINTDNLYKYTDIKDLIKFVKEITLSFKYFDIGDMGEPMFIPELEQEYQVECNFSCLEGFVRWGHIMSISSYEKEFTKENILNAPVFKVEEWGNNILFVQSFEDPFSINTQETKDKILELCKYWNSKSLIK